MTAPFAACRPALVAAGPLGRSVDLPAQTLLHAGPPYAEISEIPPLVRAAAATAAVFEGLADDEAAALDRIGDSAIRLAPAQDHGAVVPLAFIAGPSTPSLEIACAQTGARAMAPINDGPPAGALRFGAPDRETLPRLRFMAETVAPALDAMVRDAPFDPLPAAAAALLDDEDLHALVAVASRRFAEATAGRLPPEAAAYIASAQQFFLNIWMAACACFLQAAGSGFLSAAGANGRQVGLRLGDGGWITRPAPPPKGPLIDAALANRRVSPAIGDSAVIEAAGFGAVCGFGADFRASLAPYGPYPEDRLRLTALEHPAFAPHGLTLCVAADRVGPAAPMPAHFAMLDADGETGLLGRGGFVFWDEALS